MDKLPLELIRNIFGQASLDDKTTACSLILVSKCVGRVVNSRGVCFETLSLFGAAQIIGFASSLRAGRDPRVKHLFLSGIGVKEAKKRKVSRDKALEKQVQWLKKIERGEFEDGTRDDDDLYSDTEEYQPRNPELNQDMVDSVRFIIQATSGSLQTLFMTELPNIPPPFPLGQSFPELTDVSININYLGFKSNHTYPKLKRIHTTSKIRAYRSKEIVDFRHFAPVLEQLRLTDVSSYETWLPSALSGERPDILLFPDTMKRVIVQQCAPPYGATCGNAHMSYNDLCHSLKRAAAALTIANLNSSQDRGAGYGLVVLESFSLKLWGKGGANGLHYQFDDARRDWVDLIHGMGKGCWNDSGAVSVDANFTKHTDSSDSYVW